MKKTAKNKPNKKSKIKPNQKPYLYLTFSFAIPILILLVVYREFGFFPFGDKSMLITDLNGQYVDFYSYLRHVIYDGNSLIYSWSKGISGNMIGLFAYYLSSPFSFLVALFPEKNITEAIMFMTLLKIGLSGVTFALYLRYLSREWKTDIVLFSVLYALMSYSIIYSLSVMWLDAVLWLPIILMGVEKLLFEKKFDLFIISYTIALISSFYICYMITLFVGIYFTYRFICENDGFPLKLFLKKLVLLVACGISGALLSMWLLLPSVSDMLLGKLTSETFLADGFFNYNAKKLAKVLFSGQFISLTNYGLPPIYCGAIVTLLWVYYYINKNIKLKEKIATLTVILIFILSFTIKRVDMVWHMFKYPNWFPYRYAFVFCFFILFIAYRSYESIIKPKLIILSGLILSLLLLIFIKIPKFEITNAAYFTVLLTILIAVILIYKKPNSYEISIMLTIIVSVEMGVNAFDLIKGMDSEFHYISRSGYVNTISSMGNDIRQIQKDDRSFYRIEKSYFRSDNDAMNIDYKGITHYSSVFNKNLNDIDTKLGMLEEGIAVRYQGSTIATDGIFGIKYILSKNKLNDLYTVRQGIDNLISTNKYALPIAFMANDTVLTPLSLNKDFLGNQNEFLRSISGKNFFERLPNQVKNSNRITFTVLDDKPIYLTLKEKIWGPLDITVDGNKINYDYDSMSKRIYYVGQFKKGQVVEINLNKDNIYNSSEYDVLGTAVCYSFDVKKYKEWANKTRSTGLNITKFSDTYLKGDINVTENTTMFTSIAYDKGWSIYVDGKKTPTLCAYNTFLSAKIPKGIHTIKFKYHAKYLLTGTLISLATLLILIFLWYKRDRVKEYI